MPAYRVAYIGPASAVEDHRSLRKVLDEPMPRSPTMVMLYGKGGHLSTQEYSVIVVRADDGRWQRTAVGRSRIWMRDALYRPMERVQWILDEAAGRKLDQALARRCPVMPKAANAPVSSEPPPRGMIPQRIDVVTPDHPTVTFDSEDEKDGIALLVRPPD